MTEKNASPIPPGALMEIGAEYIDEGKFLTCLTAQLRKAHRDLLEYEKDSGDMTAKVVVKPTITLQRMKGSVEHMECQYQIEVKVPCVTRTTFAKEAGGRLLCQPSGTNDGNPDQQLYFDNRGRVIGATGIDLETGEELRPTVAGRIKQA